MAITQAITLTDTGVPFAQAYGRIDDSLVALSAGLLQVTLNWYPSQSIAGDPKKYLPVRIDKINLPAATFVTPNQAFVNSLTAACANGTIQTPQDALKTALYIIVQQQASYTGSVFI